MQTTNPAAPRVLGLDGLRALAVIAVVAYHLAPGVLPGGFIGVDVFFVLSGYLITRSFRRRPGERPARRLSRFWRHRARRILPPLLPVVAVTAVAAGLIGAGVLPGLWSSVLGALTFSSNWVAIAESSSYFAGTTAHPLQHLWSLAVEEQFYLVWPLLLVALGRSRPAARPWVAVGVAAASAVAMAFAFTPGTDPTPVYVGTGTHAFGLAAGAALALDEERIGALPRATLRRRVVAVVTGLTTIVVLVVAAFQLDDRSTTTYRGGLVGVSICTVSLLWSLTRGAPGIGRLLDVSPLRALGRRSYAVYLWHWPVLVLATAAIAPRGVGGHVTVAVTTIVLTVVAAALSWRWVERPVLVDGWRSSVRRVFAARAASKWAVLVTVGALTLGTGVAAAASTRPSDAEQYIATGQQYLRDHARRSAQRPSTPPTPTPATLPPTPPVGALGPTASPPPESAAPSPDVSQTRITAVGDSVMLAAAPALDAALPNCSIDAAVSRQPWDVAPILRADAASGRLADTVLVGIGTNGALGSALPAIRAAIGPDRTLVLVTAHGDRPWIARDDAMIHAFAAADPHTRVADWDQAITGHQDLLAADGIHPGAAGGRVYAQTVLAAIGR